MDAPSPETRRHPPSQPLPSRGRGKASAGDAPVSASSHAEVDPYISRRDIYCGVPKRRATPAAPSLYQDLARFRYRLRVFLRFSERAARQCGITPLQHQLLLGVAGFTGAGWATLSDLSEYLQHRHNAVVALVQRAERTGLVSKRRDPDDRRVMRVRLTPRGRRILARLSHRHRDELARFPADLTFTSPPASRRRNRTSAGRKAT
jgi:DNA-binding MarR family transcriptional regulator